MEKVNESISKLDEKICLLPCFSQFINASLSKSPPDFGDALLYEIACYHQLDYFITSNIKDFRQIETKNMPVLKTGQFNKILST